MPDSQGLGAWLDEELFSPVLLLAALMEARSRSVAATLPLRPRPLSLHRRAPQQDSVLAVPETRLLLV